MNDRPNPFDLAPEEFARLPRADREAILRILDELKRRAGQRYFYDLFPDENIIDPGSGAIRIHARHLYPRHLEFFKAGAIYRERCFLAANRVGKTTSNGYELSVHLTGEYPHWWEGRRFPHPIRAWAAGKTNETTRDILQSALLGSVVQFEGRKSFSGTGLIPGAKIGGGTWKKSVADLADTLRIKHVSGGWSVLSFKAFEQGRSAFEGTAQHVIALDEECPVDVYGECLVRTATTGGIVMLTFTPLEGLTETVLQFMPQEYQPNA